MSFFRRRFLVVAFTLSLLIHALFAFGIHRPLVSPRDETQIVTLEHRPHVLTLAKMAPHTPPPHTPPPHTPPPSTPPPHRVSNVAPGKPARQSVVPSTHLATNGAGGAGAPATAAPTPVAAATPPGCVGGDQPASLVATPPPAEIPPSVRAAQTSGVARIQVKLDANGNVTDASIKQGTGNSSLDLVALGMAKAAQYAPAQHNCKAVAGVYIFSANFVAW